VARLTGKLFAEGDGTALSGWMRFLRAEDEEEFTMVAEANPMIQKAYGVLAELSVATKTGIAKGLAEAACKMKKEGFSSEQIQRITAAEDIAKL
jgi:hypothetical protein